MIATNRCHRATWRWLVWREASGSGSTVSRTRFRRNRRVQNTTALMLKAWLLPLELCRFHHRRHRTVEKEAAVLPHATTSKVEGTYSNNSARQSPESMLLQRVVLARVVEGVVVVGGGAARRKNNGGAEQLWERGLWQNVSCLTFHHAHWSLICEMQKTWKVLVPVPLSYKIINVWWVVRYSYRYMYVCN